MSGTQTPSPVEIATRAAVGAAAGYAGWTAGSDLYNLYRNTTAAASAFDQNIVFPSDLDSVNEQRSAYCRLIFKRYVRRSIREQPRLQVESGMTLPLPVNDLKENQSVSYDTSQSLGPMVGAAADAATAAFGGGGVSPGDALRGLASGVAAQVYGNLNLPGRATNSTLGRALGLQNVADQVRAGVSSITGTSINPFQTVTFKAPNFKKHTLNWKLIPKNAQESDKIRRIIGLFKYHSSPGISAGPGVFFSYPEILEIQLFPNDAYLYRFKPCVVESVSVNYAPNGPSLYGETGAPTAVEISVSLQEIEYWTKNDYTGDRF